MLSEGSKKAISISFLKYLYVEYPRRQKNYTKCLLNHVNWVDSLRKTCLLAQINLKLIPNSDKNKNSSSLEKLGYFLKINS